MSDEIKYALIIGALLALLAGGIAFPIIYYNHMMVEAGFTYVPRIDGHWEKSVK